MPSAVSDAGEYGNKPERPTRSSDDAERRKPGAYADVAVNVLWRSYRLSIQSAFNGPIHPEERRKHVATSTAFKPMTREKAWRTGLVTVSVDGRSHMGNRMNIEDDPRGASPLEGPCPAYTLAQFLRSSMRCKQARLDQAGVPAAHRQSFQVFVADGRPVSGLDADARAVASLLFPSGSRVGKGVAPCGCRQWCAIDYRPCHPMHLQTKHRQHPRLGAKCSVRPPQNDEGTRFLRPRAVGRARNCADRRPTTTLW